MSLRATAWAWTTKGDTPAAKLVLLALADFADEVGHCWPGLGAIVSMTGLSERAVRMALRSLEESGAIETRRATGRMQTSRYVLCINRHAEKGQDLPPLEPERGQDLPVFTPKKGAGFAPFTEKRGQDLPERGQILPERGQHLPPNRQEPSRTSILKEATRLPEWLPEREWSEWCHYRRGKTWTQRAAELCIVKLSDLRDAGHDPAEVINQSIANGWRGLFELRSVASAQPSKLGWMFRNE